MGELDEAFEADDSGRAPGPDVSDKVRQGGTHPSNDGKHQRDHSPHDADKAPRVPSAHDPDQGEAGLDRDEVGRSRKAEEQERRLSIGSEDRGKPGK